MTIGDARMTAMLSRVDPEIYARMTLARIKIEALREALKKRCLAPKSIEKLPTETQEHLSAGLHRLEQACECHQIQSALMMLRGGCPVSAIEEHICVCVAEFRATGLWGLMSEFEHFDAPHLALELLNQAKIVINEAQFTTASWN